MFVFTKKKLMLVVIVALVVVGIVFFTNSKQSWLVYENSRYGFRIDYPADWRLSEAPTNNDGREFTSPDEAISCRVYGFQNALTGVSGQPMTLEEFTDWLISVDEVAKMGREELVMADQPAYELLWQDLDGTIHRGTYILNPDEGRGLHCVFDTEDIHKRFGSKYRLMVSSFESLAEDTINMTPCSSLVGGVLQPLKDMQSFIDTDYAEVTLLSRDNWNRQKLPAKVRELENNGYGCFPMPYEMEETTQSAGMNIQPVVKSILWQCELEYISYYYLDSSNQQKKEELVSQGFSCEIESCIDDQDLDGSVWLCTK